MGLRKLWALLRNFGLPVAVGLAAVVVIAAIRSDRPPDSLPVLLFSTELEQRGANVALRTDDWDLRDPSAPGTEDRDRAAIVLDGPQVRRVALPSGLESASVTASLLVPEFAPDREGFPVQLGFSWSDKGHSAYVASLVLASSGTLYLKASGERTVEWKRLEPGSWHEVKLVVSLRDRRAAAWVNDDFIAEVPVARDPEAGNPKLQHLTLESTMRGTESFVDRLAIYSGLLVPSTRLRNCATGEPHVSGDIINLVFAESESMGHALEHFEQVVDWPELEGSDLCLLGDDGTLREQDASRASHGSSQERWHVRFYHDERNGRTLAAAHRDDCGARRIGHSCRFLQSHQGIEFFRARDQVAYRFVEAGYTVWYVEQVAYISLDRPTRESPDEGGL